MCTFAYFGIPQVPIKFLFHSLKEPNYSNRLSIKIDTDMPAKNVLNLLSNYLKQ